MLNILIFIFFAPVMLPALALGLTWEWWMSLLKKKTIRHRIAWGFLAPFYGLARLPLYMADWWFSLVGE
jgi:hypothetical protein